MGRGNTGAPIRDGWSRETEVLTVPGKFKCCFTDNRSQSILIGANGQKARQAGAFNRARSARIAHLCNHMKFGAGADDNPFVKVKDLITDLISRLHAEASSETNQKSYCEEETSKATEKKEDLDADVAKHSSQLEAAVVRSIVLGGEISALQSELVVLLNRQLQMDIREKINQFAEHIKNPQIQFSNKVDEMPVAVQRQNPMVQNIQKTKEIPQLRCIDEVVGNPVVQAPRVQVVEKTVEIPVVDR